MFTSTDRIPAHKKEDRVPPVLPPRFGEHVDDPATTKGDARNFRSSLPATPEELEEMGTNMSYPSADRRRSTFDSYIRRRSQDFSGDLSPNDEERGSMTVPSIPAVEIAGHARDRSALDFYRIHGRTLGHVALPKCDHEVGAPMIRVINPTDTTTWTRGSPVVIEWEVLDDTVEQLQIELMGEHSSGITVVAKSVGNTGFFAYQKVPWGMEPGQKYFLRFSDASKSSERFITTKYFTIDTPYKDRA